MKLLKKLSAIILAVILLFSGMPMSELGLEDLFSSIAFAAEEDYEEEEEEEEEYIDTTKDYTYGDLIYGKLKSGKIIIRKYMGNGKEVTVPETIEGKTVIYIGINAFCPTVPYRNSNKNVVYSNPDSVNIESVKLPDSISQIRAGAFDGCENLKSINMPENLSSIGEEAFLNCSSLESLEFSNLRSIDINAFKGCSSLENLEFSNQLSSIGGGAFYGTKIKNLNIISPEKAFVAYKSMLEGAVVENVTIEAKSVTINSDALKAETLKNVELKGTEKVTIASDGIVSSILKKITLEGEKITVGSNGIDCDALESFTLEGKTITINNNGVKSNALKTLTLDGILTIGSYGIVCNALEDLTLIGSVSSITTDAILSTSLKNVTIDMDMDGLYTNAFGSPGDDTLPETVVVNNDYWNLAYEMFENYLNYVCEIKFTDDVKQLVFKKYVEPEDIRTENEFQYYINENGEAVLYKFSYKYNGTVDVYVPDTLGGAPVTVIGRRAFEYPECKIGLVYLPDSVTRIENNAFAHSDVRQIRISPNLQSIGCRAFYDNKALSAIGYYNSRDEVEYGVVRLPDTISTIPIEAFGECWSIRKIYAEGVTSVMDYGLSAAGLTEVKFSEDFYWVGTGAFLDCGKLEKITPTKNITHIGEKAFYNSALTEFDFNEAITEIPYFAFYSTDVESIVISSNVTAIGESAFEDCKILKELVIPESVTTIEKNAFKKCSALGVVEIPNSVTAIGESAFSDCTNIRVLKLSNALTTIGISVFYKCSNLESVEIPDSVTTIGEYAFYNCQSLLSVKFPDSVTTINMYAFSGCSSLLGVEIPDSVTTIGKNAFENCSALKSLKLSNSLTEILESTFSGCSALENLEIPDSVTAIYAHAFKNCSSLKGEFILPKNIQAIRQYAFAGTGYSVLNYNLPESDYTIQGTSYSGMDNLTTIKIGDNVTKIPENAFENLKTVKEVIMSDSVNKISSGAFKGCSGLESIKMSKNITYIGTSAFRDCSKLAEITLPECLRSIDDYAFYNCSKLTEMTLPKSLTYLGSSALPKSLTTLYYNAENLTFLVYKDISPLCHLSLTNVIFGDTIKRIPDGMFSGMKTLESLTLPDSVTEIGEKAFYKSSFKSIKLPSKLIVIEDYAFSYANVRFEGDALPNGTRMIGDYAFDHCTGFEEIYIPDSVVDIAEYAFYGCSNLKKVRMSSSVKLIASNAFAYCSSLEEFIWDSDVKLVADYAFYNCRALKNFNFAGVELVYPNSFKSSGVTLVTLGHDKNDEATDLIMVETQSFMGCENLDTVAIGGNVTTIKSEAFASCSNLETAVISDSVINIAPNAFDNCDSLTIYCEEGSYAQKFAIKNDIPVSTFVVAPIPNQTYTGSAIEPEIDVSVSGEKVMENTDFTVKYSDNINVGTAKVTVSGKGVYKVLSSIANFTIITKSIAPVTFAKISEQDYTGEAVIPTITVTDGNKVLKEGVDYTVTYKNNIDEGTATATIQGIGNYHGSASMNFEIRELSTSQSIGNMIIDFFTSFWLKIVSFFTSIFG